MLPETDGPGALKCFERILLELEAVRVGPLECLSVSVGVAEYRRPMTSETLMALATAGLERARAAGGGRTELHSCSPEGADGASAETAGHAHNGAIAGLAEALAERDRYTGEHSEAVIEMSAAVARNLGLGQEEVERVRSAALLHDIGKVAIPDEILHKPGPLTDQEWLLMREHPVIGERILRVVPGLGTVARIVRHEHERWDGRGYPDGLARDQIPIGSRIIIAADTYHAITSDRPYRSARSHGDAIEELSRCAGTQFDPKVTSALIGHLYGQRQAGSLVA
jgi:putative nucleotidyltransferase with HDIG domain